MDTLLHRETLSAPGVRLEVSIVPWDSGIFGYPVAQIDHLSLDGGDAAGEEAMASLKAWLDSHGVRLASCRLDSGALRESMLLEAHGFRFVEMVYGPRLDPIPADLAPDDELVVTAALEGDLPEIEAVAGTAFATGRHRLDWRLDPDASNDRYRQWVRSSFAGGRQRVLKAAIGGATVGFFIVEERQDLGVYWHLTAIAPGWQGRGIGKRLWRAMLRRHALDGRRRVETTISAHNVSVINLYARLGFRFAAPRMTLHWVRD